MTLGSGYAPAGRPTTADDHGRSGGRGLPEGQLFHAAGPSAVGWTIIAVHESRASWERFRDGILLPRMTRGIAGGFTSPPEDTGSEIYNEVMA